MTAEIDKTTRTEKEATAEKDKEQPMEVDKKPCEENASSTQSTTVNRTSEEEPERIVKVSYNVPFGYNSLLIIFYVKCLGF